MNRHRWPRLWLVLALLLPLQACAPTIRTTMLQPAKYDRAASLRSVAVLPFKGSGGEEFSGHLMGSLTAIEVGGRPYFTVVDREGLDQVIKEINRSNADFYFNNDAALEVGKLVGAKGIYSGKVDARGFSDQRYTERRKKCFKEEPTGDTILGIPLTRCVDEREVNVSCLKRVAVFNITPKLVEVETGRIVYTRKVEVDKLSQACEGDDDSVTDGDDLARQARDGALEQIIHDVAPHMVAVDIQLLADKSGITEAAAGDKLDQGLAYARENQMDRACELWREGLEMAPNGAALLFNVGVCAERDGDLSTALERYTEADRQLGRPDPAVSDARTRAKEGVEKQRKLRRQLQSGS